VALSYLGGRPSVAPLTVTIAGLVSSLGSGWHLLTAAAFVSMVLPLAVFFTLQRYFVRGLVAGAVKD
jgi:alpha-glucoside transport system permease protein